VLATRKQGWRRLARRCGVGGALLLAALGTARGTAEVVSESQIKAAFLYNFTRFVEWPEEGFAGKNAPIVIGVLGETSLSADLRTIVSGRKVNGRPIEVRDFDDPADAAGAQVLFVSADEDARLPELHAAIANGGVLTVGESAQFVAAGGAIAFVQQTGKLRFQINVAAAERSHVKISAELQKLAIVVRDGP
jgi:hypothetical protein